MTSISTEDRVNTYTSGNQHLPAVAQLTGGGYVVTWSSTGQDGDGDGIYAQRYSAAGVAQGPEFRVNTTTTNQQTDPAIVGLSNGGFIVTWTDYNGTDGSSNGVYAQRFDANGVAQGSEFLVNTVTNDDQSQPSIAAYNGGFVATWYSNGQEGFGRVYSQLYTNSGTKVGGETHVSSDFPTNHYEPDVAARADGSYVVVWRSDQGQDGSDSGVYGQRFDASGNPTGTEFQANTTTVSNQYQPRVAILSDGGFVVVWGDDSGQDSYGYGVFAQCYHSDGTVNGGEFLVNESTFGGQHQPDVIGLSTCGFVVAWYNDSYDLSGTGSYGDVYVRQFANDGTPLSGEIKGNTPAPGQTNQSEPALADLGNGDYVLTWTSGDNQDGSDTGVYQQLFGNAAHFTRQANPVLEDFGHTVTFAENAVNASLQVLDAAVYLNDTDSVYFDGGKIELFYVKGGSAEDQLGVVNEGNGAGQIGVSGNTVSYGGVAIGTISGGSNGANLTINFTGNATLNAVEALIQKLGYGNSSSTPTASRELSIRVSDGDGGSAVGGVVTVNVTPQLDGTPKAYGEEQVNTYTPDSQSVPAVASLTGGGYVVVWASAGQDGSADGVYAQRYTASGVAIGPELQVNTTTTNSQSYPVVTGLSNGGFVVTWTDYNGTDGSSYGVYAQRFDANGVAQGSEFLVNTFTDNDQAQSSLAAYNGGFVVTWYSNGEDSYGAGVYSQRYNNSGAKVGGETHVSGNFASHQYEPDVAARADGSYVVVWRSDQDQDGSGSGVYGQRFDASGNPTGTEFQVNTSTASNQYQPRVAILSDGGFVVVWADDGGQDGSGSAVFAQRYHADGTVNGGEFRVNEYTMGSQFQPDVIGLSTGGFVVSFYSDNVSPDGTVFDVYVREYDAAGNPVDGDRRINDSGIHYNNYQSEPALADLGNGNYVTVWTSAGQDGSSNGIFQQLFGDTAELPRQANPDLADFVGTVTFDENVVNAGPQIIDPAVSLSDSDSANFNGGRLVVSVISGYGSQQAFNPSAPEQDNFSIRNQGTGAGQVGFNVGTGAVSYAGVTIGSIVSNGQNGADLIVQFNASSTPQAVEAVIENLTYRNPSSNPTETRKVSVVVSDGDGGQSTAQTIDIHVTAQTDGAVALINGDSQVNSYTTNDQSMPMIAALQGANHGQYVIVWQSNGQDSDSWGVFGQRYDVNGSAIGPEFQVNTYTPNNQFGQGMVGIGSLSTGGFVVTWESQGQDGDGDGIFAQRYDAAGQPVGSEFQVCQSASKIFQVTASNFFQLNGMLRRSDRLFCAA